MQTIKVNGIEIEFEDGLSISIEDNGKRIVVKGKAVVEDHWHFVPPPIYPYTPWIQPVNPLPYRTPIVTCGVSSGTYQARGDEQATYTSQGLLTQ